MNKFSALLDAMGVYCDDLLAPFKDILDYMSNDYMSLSNLVISSPDNKARIITDKQKKYRRYMEDIYRLQYRQLTLVTTIPRNRPYQRRNY